MVMMLFTSRNVDGKHRYLRSSKVDIVGPITINHVILSPVDFVTKASTQRSAGGTGRFGT